MGFYTYFNVTIPFLKCTSSGRYLQYSLKNLSQQDSQLPMSFAKAPSTLRFEYSIFHTLRPPSYEMVKQLLALSQWKNPENNNFDGSKSPGSKFPVSYASNSKTPKPFSLAIFRHPTSDLPTIWATCLHLAFCPRLLLQFFLLSQ